MRHLWLTHVSLLACAWLLVIAPSATHAQVGGMSCAECHADPAGGGFHGGFRPLGNLTEDQLEVVCLSCHDGSYTNPQGVRAPEAAVHQNQNPGQGRDEYGDFKASCLDCHNNHSGLLAGDGITSTRTISSPPDVDIDEAHDVEPTTTAFRLKEAVVTEASIVITDDAGTPFNNGSDYTVVRINGDPVLIEIIPGGAINNQAPIQVFAGYEFATNQRLLGARVVQASSTDGIARIRKPIIVDPNGDNGGTGNQRFQDDFQNGWECDGKDGNGFDIPDDPTCIETDPPDAGDGVRKVAFHIDIYTSGTNWARTAPPYNGACNACHTRTGHHRRDDSGGDHTHNVSRSCDDCHNHKDGWVNKGG
ncbi:MAG: hypothetical protein OES46_17630 [Gammaproteobacteria bacterium]|nr:hypothetical protein [Gammaproteobacteria bacterium]